MLNENPGGAHLPLFEAYMEKELYVQRVKSILKEKLYKLRKRNKTKNSKNKLQ